MHFPQIIADLKYRGKSFQRRSACIRSANSAGKDYMILDNKKSANRLIRTLL